MGRKRRGNAATWDVASLNRTEISKRKINAVFSALLMFYYFMRNKALSTLVDRSVRQEHRGNVATWDGSAVATGDGSAVATRAGAAVRVHT